MLSKQDAIKALKFRDKYVRIHPLDNLYTLTANSAGAMSVPIKVAEKAKHEVEVVKTHLNTVESLKDANEMIEIIDRAIGNILK